MGTDWPTPVTRVIYAWARGGGAARTTAPGAGRTSGVKVGNLTYLYQGSQCVHQVNPFFKFNPKYDNCGVASTYLGISEEAIGFDAAIIKI